MAHRWVYTLYVLHLSQYTIFYIIEAFLVISHKNKILQTEYDVAKYVKKSHKKLRGSEYLDNLIAYHRKTHRLSQTLDFLCCCLKKLFVFPTKFLKAVFASWETTLTHLVVSSTLELETPWRWFVPCHPTPPLSVFPNRVPLCHVLAT